ISLRRSLSFDTLRLPFGNKTCFHGQLVAGKAHRFFGDLLADAADLENDTARFDDGNPVVDSAFTATHAGLGGFGCDGLIGEDANPDLTTTLHEAGERDTRGLDLARLQPDSL